TVLLARQAVEAARAGLLPQAVDVVEQERVGAAAPLPDPDARGRAVDPVLPHLDRAALEAQGLGVPQPAARRVAARVRQAPALHSPRPMESPAPAPELRHGLLPVAAEAPDPHRAVH